MTYPTLKRHRATLSNLSMAALLSLSVPAVSAPVATVEEFFQPGGMTATAENYPTLETSRQLLIAQGRAAVNQIAHNRKLTPTDDQPVVRMNRDTYYSFAVVDVSAGASITIPPVPEGKYPLITMQTIRCHMFMENALDSAESEMTERFIYHISDCDALIYLEQHGKIPGSKEGFVEGYENYEHEYVPYDGEYNARRAVRIAEASTRLGGRL